MRISTETLARLKHIKGDWWQDELNRREDPTYIRARLETLVKRFGTFEGARVLGVGSGCGSSALVMLDCSATHVTGVELDARFVDLARRRAKDEGVADRVQFLHVADTTRLSFPDGEFDIVTFNAVIEHIPPRMRRAVLREGFRCLKPGGLLVIDETPNRLIPFDAHTTGLPGIPWLPLPLACAIARRWSRIVARGKSCDEYVTDGIVGSTYWFITHALPNAQCLNRNGGDVKWISARRPLAASYQLLAATIERILNFFGIPFTAVTPSLDLVFRKRVRLPLHEI